MPGTVMPVPVAAFYDNNGDPLAGGKLYTYQAGTTTPLATYNSAALSVPNANPVVLDSAGRAPVFLSATAYKFVLKDAADVTIWTADNIVAVPVTTGNVDVAGTAGEALAATDCVYISDGAGGRTAGRWYKTDSDQTYSSNLAGVVGFAVGAIALGETGTIRVQGQLTGLSSLTAGATYYVAATAGAITPTAPTNRRQVGSADSTTTLVIAAPPSPVDASLTASGIVNLSAQTLGAGLKTFAQPPLGLVQAAVSSSDLTKNNNTTLSDVPGLALPVGASETWFFTFMCFGQSVDAADYKLAVTGPAAPTSVQYAVVASQDSPSTSAATAFGGTVAAGGANATRQAFQVVGRLVNGPNAGTLQLQMAQSVADPSDTKVFAGSYAYAFRSA